MNVSWKCALVGAILSVSQLAAQTASPPVTIFPAIYQQTLTSGMVGFTGSQTVQFNVLNLSPATTATVSVPCQVQLEFFDAQGRMVKQGAATNVAPGAAVSLTLGRNEVPASSSTAPRVSIRGEVHTVPTPVATGNGSPANVLGSCSLMATLEIYDNVTGVTQALTSDMRPVYSGVVPLVTTGPLGGK